MAVYVDELVAWGGDDAPKCFRHRESCHMYADTLDELHAMAVKIGLKRQWFQNHPRLKHYDLTASRRAAAVRCGSVEHDFHEAVSKWKEIRGQA